MREEMYVCSPVSVCSAPLDALGWVTGFAASLVPAQTPLTHLPPLPQARAAPGDQTAPGNHAATARGAGAGTARRRRGPVRPGRPPDGPGPEHRQARRDSVDALIVIRRGGPDEDGRRGKGGGGDAGEGRGPDNDDDGDNGFWWWWWRWYYWGRAGKGTDVWWERGALGNDGIAARYCEFTVSGSGFGILSSSLARKGAWEAENAVVWEYFVLLSTQDQDYYYLPLIQHMMTPKPQPRTLPKPRA